MKILSRQGSLVIIEDKNGLVWLTRRKKRRHDSRRKVPHVTGKPSVIYIPIKQLMKHYHFIITFTNGHVTNYGCDAKTYQEAYLQAVTLYVQENGDIVIPDLVKNSNKLKAV